MKEKRYGYPERNHGVSRRGAGFHLPGRPGFNEVMQNGLRIVWFDVLSHLDFKAAVTEEFEDWNPPYCQQRDSPDQNLNAAVFSQSNHANNFNPQVQFSRMINETEYGLIMFFCGNDKKRNGGIS
jgi:hypothetical protein